MNESFMYYSDPKKIESCLSFIALQYAISYGIPKLPVENHVTILLNCSAVFDERESRNRLSIVLWKFWRTFITKLCANFQWK